MMHLLMIINAISTVALIVVLADGARYSGKYSPGAGVAHSVGIAVSGGVALLSWAGVTAMYWLGFHPS